MPVLIESYCLLAPKKLCSARSAAERRDRAQRHPPGRPAPRRSIVAQPAFDRDGHWRPARYQRGHAPPGRQIAREQDPMRRVEPIYAADQSAGAAVNSLCFRR